MAATKKTPAVLKPKPMTLKSDWTGATRLVMHDPRLSDPMDPGVIAMKKLTSKNHTKKTLEDHRAISRMEFDLGMYRNRTGPYIPRRLIRACIWEGCKVFNKGADFRRTALIVGGTFEYDGPTDLDEMWTAALWSRESVVVNKNRVWRTRPVFEEWKLTGVEITFDASVIDPGTLRDAIEIAGRLYGIGDARNMGCGRFTVVHQ